MHIVSIIIMGLRLREILKNRHITIGQFSEMSGISQSNLSNYMMGKVSPTLETLNKIAGTLKVDITELFKKEEEIVLMARIGEKEVEISKDELLNFIKSKIEGDGENGNKKDK